MLCMGTNKRVYCLVNRSVLQQNYKDLSNHYHVQSHAMAQWQLQVLASMIHAGESIKENITKQRDKETRLRRTRTSSLRSPLQRSNQLIYSDA